MVDYIADYLENIRTRRVFPNVVPGYMRELVPDHAPVEGEAWENIFRDVERVIMPGVGSRLHILVHVLRYINNYDAAVHSNSLFNVSNNSLACCGRHWTVALVTPAGLIYHAQSFKYLTNLKQRYLHCYILVSSLINLMLIIHLTRQWISFLLWNMM